VSAGIDVYACSVMIAVQTERCLGVLSPALEDVDDDGQWDGTGSSLLDSAGQTTRSNATVVYMNNIYNLQR
jgi:hypothetical protein